ncbi:MAG: hypothetical protein BMS9Abin31_0831 [Gammaproteobacteria bacterium]|nr:MAG: hypothetical protein BMS9Abin31_0831 [Gammaproteobacteria bacterium]
MSVIINKTGKILVLTVLLFCSHVSYTLAQQSEPLLNFKFNHLSNIPAGDLLSLETPSINSDSLQFAQFDATWTYPWELKNFNIDLGVTLRHLSGFKNSTERLGNTRFQEVLPLLHASALFALPLKGLSAGIEGSHLDTSERQIFDYRAKVSYEWRKGFGLQGGWQHQQFNLENAANSGADYERTGPFLDFYLNF